MKSLVQNKYLFMFLTITLLCAQGIFVIAASPFNPGETLDPAADFPLDCSGPADTDCYVQIVEIERDSGAPASSPLGLDPIFYINETSGAAYTYDGSQWNLIGGNSWGRTGNAGTDGGATNFMGTTDNVALQFRTNNAQTGFISADGDALFFGLGAGGSSASQVNTNFFGENAGNGATAAQDSNFFGTDAGSGATNASFSNLLGQNAGLNVTGANHLNFLGLNAGNGAINANDSNFFGEDAGRAASSAFNANFMGLSAGQNATAANNSNFFGFESGLTATAANNSNFFGQSAGSGATAAEHSNFFGFQAGTGATGADNSNFFGFQAGEGADAATESNFFGLNAGAGATDANNSNFIGSLAGINATDANNSNFIGNEAGHQATNASDAVFIGTFAGNNAADAKHSIFIGYFAGSDDLVNNIAGGTSILIGDDTSTGGFSNAIALGAGATNTTANQFMIGSSSDLPIDVTRINGSAATQCTITTGTGIACTSDERVKTNIEDLPTDILGQLSNIRTVTYNWLGNPGGKQQLGFLAQNLEEYFPQLVDTDNEGMKSVYYAQMTPILVEAIRELDIKIDAIDQASLQIDGQNLFDRMIAWFADRANGIQEIIAGKFRATDQLCINDTCVTELQLQQLLSNTDSDNDSDTGNNNPDSEDTDNDQSDSDQGDIPDENPPDGGDIPPSDPGDLGDTDLQ